MESAIINMTLGEVCGRIAAAVNVSTVTPEARAELVEALGRVGQVLTHARLGDVLGLAPMAYSIQPTGVAKGTETRLIAEPVPGELDRAPYDDLSPASAKKK